MRSFIYEHLPRANSAIHLFSARVIKACYKIKDTGELYLDIHTNKDAYIRDIERSTNTQLLTKLHNDTIASGDIVAIYISNLSGDNFVNKNSTFEWEVIEFNDKNRIEVDTTDEISYCPVCGSFLHIESGTNKLYCLNNDCLAKLIFTIRKFLILATHEQWNFEELIIFNKLVTMGRIKSLSDIYTITLDELESFNSVWYSGKEKNIAISLYKKINQTRGTITVYNFLNSINIPRNIGWKLNKQPIDKYIPTIADFLDIISESTPNSSKILEMCMSTQQK